jgi:hypothetical protein
MSLRMTIGERLGRLPRGTTPPAKECRREPEESSGVPLAIQPEKVVRLVDAPSAQTLPFISVGWHCSFCQEQHFAGEVCPESEPRVRGEMVWLHKTAPTLVIEGRDGLSPEDHAAGRRR